MGQGPKHWLPFFFSDFYGSARVQALGPEGRDYYLRLLCSQWQDPDCRLPDDDDELAILSGAGPRWPEFSRAIRKCFVSTGGFLSNPRCVVEANKTKALYESRIAGGRATAAKRWGSDSSAIAQQPLSIGKPQPQPQEEKQSIRASGTAPNGAIDRLWSEYLDRTGRDPRLLSLTPQRRAKAAARWREALAKAEGDPDTAEKLMSFAIARLADSDWHMGRDAKTCGKKYCDWETNLFRSAEQFEKWLEQPTRVPTLNPNHEADFYADLDRKRAAKTHA